MNIFKQINNSNSNICICFIVGMLLFISIIPFSYAEKTYDVYVEPLPESGNFAQSSVSDALDWWEQKLPDIKFKIVSNPESADFTIQWVKDFGTEVIGYAFDDLFMEVGLGDSEIGSGTWYPYSTNYVTDIVKHEVGHILGLDHVNNPQDIMYPVTANTEYGLIELQIDLLPDEAYFMPVFTTKDTTTINYQINSENAEYGFDVYVVPSEADLDKWASDAPFNFYQDQKCFAENIFHASGTCDVEYGSGLLIISNDIEVNKRTYFDVKMTEQSIKYDNVLSSAPSSSVPSNIIPTSSSSYNLYVDENSRFSVEYPANWYVYYDDECFEDGWCNDWTYFYDNDESWTSSFSIEGFELTDVYVSNTSDGKLEEMKEYEKDWCDTQTYAEAGQICYNFEIITSDIKILDSGQEAFVIAEKYTLQYGSDFPGEFPITAVVTEIHNGNDAWIVYTESDNDAYPAHKEKIMNFIQSFSLSDKSNSVQIPSTASVPPATSVPPTTVTPQFTGIAVPSPQIPTSIPTQSIIIEGAFLNIDPPTISLSHSDDTVKIYGNIGREPDKGERVIINLNLPDNTVHSPERLHITDEGYFETYYRIDMKSVTGTYFIDAMLRETLIGEVTLRIGEYSSQSSTTIPQNPEIINSLERTDVDTNEFQQEKSFETGIKNESFKTETDDEQFKTGIEDEQFESEISDQGGGCLIATATYGSELAPQVQQLRELRDNQLLQTESGTVFMGTFNDIYYSFSPIIADYERENPYFKEAVKLAITPMISSLSLMENANSESEVLSIGISVIMLNLGMYLGVPAIVIIGIRKKI
jgi:hypothetical protein